MKISNVTVGPRGFHTVSGPVMLEPGQSVEDVEIGSGDLKAAKASGWFDIAGAHDRPATSSSDTERGAAAAELLEQLDSLHFQTFRKQAGEILGPDNLPDKKDEIVEALKRAAG